MHRTIEASVPAESVDAIVRELKKDKNVVGLNVLRGVSVKPPGDTLLIHVLNRGADDVMRTIRSHIPGESFSIITSEVASINDPENQRAIDHDIDEAIWEEMETGLRHNGRLTANYLMLMALGGIIVAVGFVSPVHQQVIAFVSASIIAPGLEPLAKIPLGFVLRRSDVLWTGLKATVVGYGVLAFAAALAFRLLMQVGDAQEATFLQHEATSSLLHPKFKDKLISLAAAASSILMYLAYRRNVIAGPLIALVLIPAAAGVGMSLSIGEWGYAGQIGEILAMDVIMVLITGVVLIFAKQKMVHRRQPLR